MFTYRVETENDRHTESPSMTGRTTDQRSIFYFSFYIKKVVTNSVYHYKNSVTFVTIDNPFISSLPLMTVVSIVSDPTQHCPCRYVCTRVVVFPVFIFLSMSVSLFGGARSVPLFVSENNWVSLLHLSKWHKTCLPEELYNYNDVH